MTLLALLAARIAIRLIHKPPPLPDSIRGLERSAAHLGHAALYALPALVIAAGWAETNFGGHAVQWFGVGMPRIFPETEEALQNLSTDVHMWLAYAMLAVAVGHVAAAYKHRWFDGHDVIRRMTFDGKWRRPLRRRGRRGPAPFPAGARRPWTGPGHEERRFAS